ncbi:MAG: helix-turn-helix domain-containing protein [Clostridiales Family XIII bacterium]|nr:helix-turn-helix domain-containing protein [Clostridiales Family XIII bacterium]
MKLKTKINDAYTLGQVLQQGRLLRGVSQREMAKLLGTGQKWVWEMEQGKQGLLMNRLFRMLEETGVTLYAEFETEA